MDVLKRVEDLLKSGDVTNLELLVEEEKMFCGGFRAVSFVQCLGSRPWERHVRIKIRSKRNIGPKKQFIKYIYRFDVNCA